MNHDLTTRRQRGIIPFLLELHDERKKSNRAIYRQHDGLTSH